MTKRAKFVCSQHPFVTDKTKRACEICDNALVEVGLVKEQDAQYRNPTRFTLTLCCTIVLLAVLVLLNLKQFRDPLYEWPGEFASTVLEWVIATAAICLALPLFYGHARNKDAHNQKWALLPLIVAIGIAYLFSLTPTFLPEQIPASLRGPKGGVVVLFMNMSFILVGAMLIRWIELILTNETRWQFDQHGGFRTWWSPRQLTVLFVVLTLATALAVFLVLQLRSGSLVAISAVLSILTVVNIYSISLATRLPAKFASKSALDKGIAVLSADLMLQPEALENAVSTGNQREVFVSNQAAQHTKQLATLSRFALRVAKQNWWLIVLCNAAALLLTTGLLNQWLPISITPAKAIAIHVAIGLLIILSSIRVRIHRWIRATPTEN